MANKYLSSAKSAKNDEFYTLFHDIEKEVAPYLEYDPDVFRDKTILLPCDDPEWSNFTIFFAQNFERFGLKKLISTSYAGGKKCVSNSKCGEGKRTNKDRGKIFTLTHDKTGDDKIDINDLEWEYMDCDGDFRCKAVTTLRDEADIIITNPPFSLFREFLAWILEAEKELLIIGNINVITYKEVFPLLKQNKVWLGNGMGRWISGFIVPKDYELYGTEARIDESGNRIVATNNCLWLTNLDHGRRHNPLPLMSMEDNLRFNKKIQKNKNSYKKYDNYDVIEVPFTDAIPSDYDGIMGVPITFLDKYSPEQFEILGIANSARWIGYECLTLIQGKKIYNRILIKRKN